MADTPVAPGSRPERSEKALRELMVRYQAADREAAEQLVETITPLLFRFFASLRESAVPLEDLVQECWLRIHKARHSYRPEEPVLPWIFAIARHTRVDCYRRWSRSHHGEVALEETQMPAPGPPRNSNPGEGLLQMLDTLPESQREVIVMLKVTGMSLEEVARATSSTVGAVKQKAHRAYEKLRRTLDPNPTADAK